MTEKNIENVSVSKERLLQVRSAIINRLAAKKLMVQSSDAYLWKGTPRHFWEVFKKSIFTRGAGYLLFASIFGIIAVLWYGSPALNPTLFIFIGSATGALITMGITAIVCMSEVKAKERVERMKNSSTQTDFSAIRKWLSYLDEMLGIDYETSSEEIDKLVEEKSSF